MRTLAWMVMSLKQCCGLVAACVWFAFAAGCRTPAPMAAVNLNEPGWSMRQGQAIWRSAKEAPEIAGEVWLAAHPDGRSLLQFMKTPLPFVTVQTRDDTWQIEFVPQQRRFQGAGQPPARLSWVYLAHALGGRVWEGDFSFTMEDGQEWVLENRRTGEMISGFLNP